MPGPPAPKGKAKAKAALPKAVPNDAENPVVWPKLFGVGAPKEKAPPPVAPEPPAPDPEFDLLEFTTEHEALFGVGGAPLTAREKILLCIINRNLRAQWGGNNVETVRINGRRRKVRDKPDLKAEFLALTGFRYHKVKEYEKRN